MKLLQNHENFPKLWTPRWRQSYSLDRGADARGQKLWAVQVLQMGAIIVLDFIDLTAEAQKSFLAELSAK